MADRTLTSFAHKLLAAERPDLIHIGHPLRLAEFAHVAQARQIPYLVTLTDYWMLCGRFFLITQGEELCAGPRGGLECRRACPKLDQQQVEQRLAAARQICRQAQAVIAPSHFLADCVQREFGPLSVQVIPYGIATADLQLNQRNYPTDEPLVILFAGRFKAEKGIALLLTAFRQLPTAKIRLEIYGSGPFEPMVRQAATDDRRIHFGGVYTQSELNTLLNRVDVVVIPSLWHENLPLIMQEAQACGVPTLVSDVGGMTECVTDGVNGFTFRVGDVADLQRKLQLIIDQPEMLNAIKANIRQPKRGQYQVTSLAQEAALYLEKYAKILAPPVVATSITHEVPSSPLTRSVSRANDSEFL